MAFSRGQAFGRAMDDEQMFWLLKRKGRSVRLYLLRIVSFRRQIECARRSLGGRNMHFLTTQKFAQPASQRASKVYTVASTEAGLMPEKYPPSRMSDSVPITRSPVKTVSAPAGEGSRSIFTRQQLTRSATARALIRSKIPSSSGSDTRAKPVSERARTQGILKAMKDPI
jgi:hypothetical protein